MPGSRSATTTQERTQGAVSRNVFQEDTPGTHVFYVLVAGLSPDTNLDSFAVRFADAVVQGLRSPGYPRGAVTVTLKVCYTQQPVQLACRPSTRRLPGHSHWRSRRHPVAKVMRWAGRPAERHKARGRAWCFGAAFLELQEQNTIGGRALRAVGRTAVRVTTRRLRQQGGLEIILRVALTETGKSRLVSPHCSHTSVCSRARPGYE